MRFFREPVPAGLPFRRPNSVAYPAWPDATFSPPVPARMGTAFRFPPAPPLPDSASFPIDSASLRRAPLSGQVRCPDGQGFLSGRFQAPLDNSKLRSASKPSGAGNRQNTRTARSHGTRRYAQAP